MATDVKKQIADVFIKKSRQIGMDKVTISMIVSECGISRQAFYYYFQDILDVARYVMREGLKITYEEGEKARNPKDAVFIFVDDLVRQFPLISIAVNSKLRGKMEILLVNEMKSFFSFILSHMDCGRGLKREQIEFHSDFIACGVVLYSIEHCNDSVFCPENFRDQLWSLLSQVYGGL